MWMLCLVGCIFTLLCLARLTFTLLFFVPALVCLSNETSTETCGNDVLPQDVKDEINMAGTFVEAGSSFLAIWLIFCWGKFNVLNFFLAAPRLAVFWFWIGLFSLKSISTINMDFHSGKTEADKWTLLGVSLILENATLVLLSLALKFIDKSTVKAWVNRTVASQQWAKFLYYIYILTLWMYLLRNLSLLFYDMATLTKKIDRHTSEKHIDNVLKIADIAARGSFVQFYYASIFRNPNLSTVCKEQARPLDDIFPIAIGVSSGPREVIAWEPYIK